jgi:hypothetical protein
MVVPKIFMSYEKVGDSSVKYYEAYESGSKYYVALIKKPCLRIKNEEEYEDALIMLANAMKPYNVEVGFGDDVFGFDNIEYDYNAIMVSEKPIPRSVVEKAVKLLTAYC